MEFHLPLLPQTLGLKVCVTVPCSPILFFKTEFLTGSRGLPITRGCLASEPQGSFCLRLLSTGLVTQIALPGWVVVVFSLLLLLF